MLPQSHPHPTPPHSHLALTPPLHRRWILKPRLVDFDSRSVNCTSRSVSVESRSLYLDAWPVALDSPPSPITPQYPPPRPALPPPPPRPSPSVDLATSVGGSRFPGRCISASVGVSLFPVGGSCFPGGGSRFPAGVFRFPIPYINAPMCSSTPASTPHLTPPPMDVASLENASDQGGGKHNCECWETLNGGTCALCDQRCISFIQKPIFNSSQLPRRESNSTMCASTCTVLTMSRHCSAKRVCWM
jgi:hypothetical protein